MKALLLSGVTIPVVAALVSATVRHKVARWWRRRDGDDS